MEENSTMNFLAHKQLIVIFLLTFSQLPSTLKADFNFDKLPFFLIKSKNEKIHHLPTQAIEKSLLQISAITNPSEHLRSIDHLKNSRSQTIVEKEDQISDFDARFEMAKIFSHHKESISEALILYAILKQQKPDDSKLLLEMSRAYISQEDFNQALQLLAVLLNEEFLIPEISYSQPNLSSQEKIQLPRQQEQSIVPLDDQITEDQARLELARIYSHYDNHLDEAIEQYLILLEKDPHNVDLILEISRIYIRQKKFCLALSLLYPAIDEHPCHADLLVEAAHAEHGLSHAKQSQALFLKALPLSKKPDSVLLDYANILVMVGSFYKAEEIYRNALKTKDTVDAYLQLAWVLINSQRYEEAEGILRQLLLEHPNHPKVLEALAILKVLEKDFPSALETIDLLLSLYPNDPSYILLRANTLYKHECYIDALKDFEDLSQYPKYYSQALIGMGKTYLKLCQNDEAHLYFQKTYDHDPTLIEAQFYLAGSEIFNPEFILKIIEKTSKPEDLDKWAKLYAENGMAGITDLYEAALLIDPDYFPAQIGLAEALSINYRYDESIEIYLSILDVFPDNSKIMTAIARVYSWAKQYKCSFKWYDRLSELNPQDPLPRREKARAAYWGYFFDYSMQTYRELLNPSVDQLLLESLIEFNQQNCNDILTNGVDLLSQAIANGSIYTGYEKVFDFFTEQNEQIDSCQRTQIEKILIQYFPKYRIQKSVSLERYGKELDWKNYYLHALPVYQELASFSPGNEEGLYSLAQDYCSLGLCGCSRRLYYHLLNISPNHNLVKMALERNLIKDHLLLQSNYLFWKERGSGQFSQSQIDRQQFDEVLEWSPSCNFHLRFIQNTWLEHPFFNNHYYPAEGQTIEVDRIFNGFVKGSAGATYKNYFNQFVSRYTCFSTLWFNVYDYFNLGIGFERKNEIYNYFSLKQGIQAKIYWLSVTSNLTHYWNMSATYRHLEYNDKNTLEHVEVTTSYVFSDDPDVFKIILRASYRNTAHLTRLIIDPSGDLVNVIHPYWTPRDYWANSITLEYRHNFAFFNYCEGPQRYLDIKLTGEEDTARNPSFEILCEWHYDFMYHWGFELKGMIHQSKLWNAEGAWATVYYRF